MIPARNQISDRIGAQVRKNVETQLTSQPWDKLLFKIINPISAHAGDVWAKALNEADNQLKNPTK